MQILEKNYSIENILSQQKEFKKNIDKVLLDYIEQIEQKDIKKFMENSLFPGRRLRSSLLRMLVEDNINVDILNNLCIAIELCHRASIILDDMIDFDTVRRGVPAFHTVHGNAETILVSHYMVGEAYNLIEFLPKQYKPSIYVSYTEAYRKITYGEMGDIGALTETNYIDLYMTKILFKTSAPFQLVFKWVSILNSLDYNESKIMAEIGLKIGDMYQLFNDIYDDLSSSEEERGEKPIYKINYSLMICIALEYGSEELISRINYYIKNGCNKIQYQALKKDLHNNLFQKIANEIADKANLELEKLIMKLSDKKTQNYISAFSKWLKQEKCWNQNEFENAGY